MKAVYYSAFRATPEIKLLPDPAPPAHGVVVRVRATGVCRSDWHGWMGHDPDIRLPHVPGHELAGLVEEVGKDAKLWKKGDRVTVPFVSGCGHCPQCHTGNQHICDNQMQPGFTHWGSFAELVAIHYADINLVCLPESIDFATAASLGCRFSTSFRAVVDQGRTQPGEWLAVHDCGGVGLSAIMIAVALGANVVAIDIGNDKLEKAKSLGAVATVNAKEFPDVAAAIMELTLGGAHISVDALGHPTTCFNSVACLRKRGRHVQVGLLLADQAQPPIPMDKVISRELEIIGSHGMQAHRYDAIFAMMAEGRLKPDKLIGHTISLEESISALMNMDKFESNGVTVVTKF